MNGEQLFELLGELDESMVLAAAHPPRRRRPVNAWLLAAAAAVVVGVLGYAGLMRAWRDAPPIEPVTPTTAVMTTSWQNNGGFSTAPSVEQTTTTAIQPTSVAPVTTTTTTTTTTISPHVTTTRLTGPDTVVTTTQAVNLKSTTTTTATANLTTTLRPREPDAAATTTQTAAPYTSTTTTTTKADGTTSERTTGIKRTTYTCTTTTTTVSTTYVKPTTVPVTKGTMPNGLPVLNSDYEVETDRLNGYTDVVFGYSFEELQVSSITAAPSVLPVYTVTEKRYERHSLTDIIEKCMIVTDDNLVSGIYDDGKSADATGHQFRYHINRGQGNYIMLSLMKPITLGTPDQWLAQVTAYCPALFRDMAQPTLLRWNGSRWWNKQYVDSPATAQETVSFYARIYDVSQQADAASKWLDGVSLKIEDGKLTALCVMFEENYQKLGDYPILSVAEATALAREQCETLKNYPYYTIISENYEILSTELVYMPHSASGLRVPLYRFLVTTDGAEYMSELRAETGLTMYYAVYVTAVPPAYWTAESRDRFITQK